LAETRRFPDAGHLFPARCHGYDADRIALRDRISTEQSGFSRSAIQEHDSMSKKLALALVLVGLAAACAKKEPEVVPVTTVAAEPVYQGKYGAN
jgi:hypothetical protein